MKKLTLSLFMLTVFVTVCLLGNPVSAKEKPSIPEIPRMSVNMSIGPYVCHCFNIIGVEKGWFEEVGISIEPKPYGRIVILELLQTLLAGTVDVNRSFNGEYAAFMARKGTENVKIFALASLFQGYAILGKPSYKSVRDFTEEGLDFEEAVKRTMAQLKGKRFAAPTDIAARAFHNLCFKTAGMSPEETKTTILKDPRILALAHAGRTDFPGPAGAPVIVELMNKGWKALITSEDFVKFAIPSPDSEALLGVGYSGWAATEEWLKENRDTAFRLLSVLYRITDLYHDDIDEAANLQLPYLNSIAGTHMTVEGIKGIILHMDPFFTFEEAGQTVYNPNSPYYYAWQHGAHLKEYRRKGIIKEEVVPADLYWADEFYKEMWNLRLESSALIEDVVFARDFLTEEERNSDAGKTVADLLEKARYWFDARNYLDAKRFVVAALEWAKYARK